jgi:hypothetical protein
MNSHLDPLMARVAAQGERLPEMYGHIDFSATPERYTEDPQVVSALNVLAAKRADRRSALLANREVVNRLRAYTMHGDPSGDAYATLIRKYGFHQLIEMLVQACDKGVETVEGAPPELVAFIREMETVPDWVDMRLVEKGARVYRRVMAHRAPLVLRGGLFATFVNKYAALPMALTGALSNNKAARRAMETATFFTVTVMPGALERHGPGFKAAAMVRLMHSMVRFHALTRPGAWDSAVFGVPIPQVDQMPAGLIFSYRLALGVIKEGRDRFTESERAQIELARYRCFLLGLPAELLPDSPQSIVDVLETRHATLRDGFDDATCGALLRATMAADLGHDAGLMGWFYKAVEPSVAKLFLLKNFLSGNRERAALLGVHIRPVDRLLAAIGLLSTVVPMMAYGVADRIPGLRDLADRLLVRKLTKLLSRYGHAEFTTDGSAYRPAATPTE